MVIKMNVDEILKHVDHTLLQQTATWEEIRQICDDAVRYRTASVCIPPDYVKQAAEYVGDKMAVCTVIGFPNGYMTTKTKEFEAKEAIADGASEIDMVINIGWLKDKKYDSIEEEIRILKTVCGKKILKVIVETCLLTEEEKIKMCEIVTRAGADYIKTSTGFSTAGASFDDVRLFAEHIGSKVKIKAAGGISSMEDAEKFLSLGAERLGTSRMIKLIKDKMDKEKMDYRKLDKKRIEEMIALAMEQMQYSYAPYSEFKVGAALLTENGKLYTGCNVENAAYAPSNCAERTAFFKAVSEGERAFRAICVVGGKNGTLAGYTPPCGVCRQVMTEFCDPETFQIILATDKERYEIFSLKEMFPLGFGPAHLA